MNVCKVNSSVVEALSNKNQKLLDSDEKERLRKIDVIDQNREGIKAVLLTLCNCTDTSRLDYWFGTKRELRIGNLKDCVDSFNSDTDIPSLSNNDIGDTNKHLLKVVNEISEELYGIKYRLKPPAEMFGYYTYLWTDETLGEWFKNYLSIVWYYLKSPLVMFLIMFFWLVIPLMFLFIILELIENRKYITMSFKCRSVV